MFSFMQSNTSSNLSDTTKEGEHSSVKIMVNLRRIIFWFGKIRGKLRPTEIDTLFDWVGKVYHAIEKSWLLEKPLINQAWKVGKIRASKLIMKMLEVNLLSKPRNDDLNCHILWQLQPLSFLPVECPLAFHFPLPRKLASKFCHNHLG